MEALDLTGLASATAEKLHLLWNEMGVDVIERDSFLFQLTEDVAAIYNSRVDGQEMRKASLNADIATLQTTIANMIHAMEESACVVCSYTHSNICFFMKITRKNVSRVTHIHMIYIFTNQSTPHFQLFILFSA